MSFNAYRRFVYFLDQFDTIEQIGVWLDENGLTPHSRFLTTTDWRGNTFAWAFTFEFVDELQALLFKMAWGQVLGDAENEGLIEKLWTNARLWGVTHSVPPLYIDHHLFDPDVRLPNSDGFFAEEPGPVELTEDECVVTMRLPTEKLAEFIEWAEAVHATIQNDTGELMSFGGDVQFIAATMSETAALAFSHKFGRYQLSQGSLANGTS